MSHKLQKGYDVSMRLQQALSGFARNWRRTIINIFVLFVFIVTFYVLHPDLTWENVRYGLTVGGILAAFEITLRALIKWIYGTSSTAKRLLQAVTVACWVAFIIIVSVYNR